MVARLSSVPSFGHRPPGWRWSIRSPRWEPPRVMSKPSARTIPEWSRRTSVGVEEEQLADAAGGGEPVPDQQAAQHRLGGPVLQIPAVRRLHRADGPTHRGFGQPAVGLDFRELGHGSKVPPKWQAVGP
jgi:hypothetical protein